MVWRVFNSFKAGWWCGCRHQDNRLVAAAPKLLSLLRHLYDLQNDSPLEKYRKEWEQVMAEVAELLNKLDG